MAKRLTIKEASFVREYFETGNASAAYRLAYPASRRWSPHAVAVEASRMKKKKKIWFALLIAEYGDKEVGMWARDELQRREERKAKDQEGREARDQHWLKVKAAVAQKISERLYWER